MKYSKLGLQKGILQKVVGNMISLKDLFKSILPDLNVPFVDDCCPTGDTNLPMAYNKEAGGKPTYYDPLTKTWEDSNAGVPQDLYLSSNDFTGDGLTPATEITLNEKVFAALITQSGTSIPTMKILKNTLGGVPFWTYNSVGIYSLTLAGAFTDDKTLILNGGNDGAMGDGGGNPAGKPFGLVRTNSSKLVFNSTNELDVYENNRLLDYSIKIEVFS